MGPPERANIVNGMRKARNRNQNFVYYETDLNIKDRKKKRFPVHYKKMKLKASQSDTSKK